MWRRSAASAMERCGWTCRRGGFREPVMAGEVMALERASKGEKVVPKRNLPEYAQLKAPSEEAAVRPRTIHSPRPEANLLK